eukprot:Blabericola_migrator_1__10431@NODE_58_length_15904_cov_68_205342_g53_i0_p13_GENE_NODE_58_length_15904_cov_68_205342_g53_i0NODE_58_length_15904_cov_68_205342_g53_i0_p13_ORF_typecomplete_len102_score11_27ARS2/PF04959_13/3_1_NODE_58_length_15904_cov_68_205342_g53_i01039610701
MEDCECNCVVLCLIAFCQKQEKIIQEEIGEVELPPGMTPGGFSGTGSPFPPGSPGGMRPSFPPPTMGRGIAGGIRAPMGAPGRMLPSAGRGVYGAGRGQRF